MRMPNPPDAPALSHRQYKSPLHFEGVGGEAMTAEGLTSLFPMKELTVAGFAEVRSTSSS
jgi:lipid A disaccharide synthetase